MSAISLKSITGITSITTPAGVDNQLTLHNNNTTEAVKLDTAGNLHFHNHLNITGVSTASNFKTGSTNVHSTGVELANINTGGGTAAFGGGITVASHVNVSAGYSFQWGDSHERIEQSDGKIEFFTNNTEKMTLSGSNLGIGTVSPSALLHLHKASGDIIQKIESSNGAAALELRHTNGYGYIRYFQDGTETFRAGQIAQFTSYSIYNPSNSLPYQFCVEGNGEVGINTHNPVNTLHLLRNSTNHGITLQRGGTNAGSASINVTSFGALDLTAANNLNLTSGGSQQILFNRGATAVAKFDTSGRFMIGTTTEGQSTADDLTIATSGTTGITIRSGTSNDGNIYFSDGTSGSDEFRGYIQYGHSNNDMVFGTNSIERLRIRADGEIRINHTQTHTPLNNTFISIWDANSDSSAIDASGVSKNYAMISLHNYGTGVPGDTTGIAFGAGSGFGYTKGSVAFQRTGSYGTGDLVFLTNNDQDTTMVNDTDEKMRIKRDGNVTISNTTTSPSGDFRMLTLIARSDKQASIGFAQQSGVYSGATATAGYSLRLVGDGALELATHNSNIIALKATQTGNVEMVGDLSTNNLSGRNIVINGDMRVAQRGTSSSMSNHGNDFPACDRWQYSRNGVTATVAQVAEAPDGSGFRYSLKWTSTSAVGSISAGNALIFLYKIERQDIQRLGYGSSGANKATISFWAKGSLSGKIGVSCRRDGRVFSANEDIVANTWKFVEIVIPADTSTGFSANDHDTGFQFSIVWGAGSNSTSGTTGGSWINFHNAYTAGFTAGQQGAYLTTNGSTFQITGVQLEIGSQSTPFEYRSYGDSLMNCYRYYAKIFTNTSDFPFGVGYKYATTSHAVSVQLPTRLRSTPTCTFSGLRIRGGNTNNTNNAETVTSVSAMSYSNSNFQSFTATTNVNSAVIGSSVMLTNSVSNNTSYIAFDAEL